MTKLTVWLGAIALLLCAPASAQVETQRVPDGGLQPQVVVSKDGTVHLLYFRGEPRGGNLFYIRRAKGAAEFSQPVRVNSGDGAAVAIGNVRGAHLAVGKNGRAHVAWMGSQNTKVNGVSPMLYARMKDDGKGFEDQRNLLKLAKGLDGGGSIAADAKGNVYVAWHADPSGGGEGTRAVYLVASNDDGKTWSKERQANREPTGACGCCGMRAFANEKGALYLMYRTATGGGSTRNMQLLVSKNNGKSFKGGMLHPWKIGMCVMSTAQATESPAGMVLTWETKEQVWFATVSKSGKIGRPVAAPGQARGRKHSAVARNDKGQILLVWTEGMRWKQGGRVAWQLYDKNLRPIGKTERRDGVPAWSLVAAYAMPDGGFTVVY